MLYIMTNRLYAAHSKCQSKSAFLHFRMFLPDFNAKMINNLAKNCFLAFPQMLVDTKLWYLASKTSVKQHLGKSQKYAHFCYIFFIFASKSYKKAKKQEFSKPPAPKHCPKYTTHNYVMRGQGVKSVHNLCYIIYEYTLT